MAYVTFQTTDGRHSIVGIYNTSGEAIAGAEGDADVIALATELTGDAFPMDTDPGWFLSALDATTH